MTTPTYSGTIGTTTITVQALIDHAGRVSGKTAEELTIEQVQAAKENLFMLLNNIANMGINYWCIQKNVIGLVPETYEYVLPIGTIDVLNSNYRTVTQVTTGAFASSGNPSIAYSGSPSAQSVFLQTSPNGYIGINGGTNNPIYVATVGILPSVNLTTNIAIQCSPNGTTWTTVYAPGSVSWVANTWIYYELDPSNSQPYWRIIETGGATLQMLQLVWGTAPSEIPLARMNRDDYTNLPNKQFLNDRPLQFWFNRTIPQPKMTVWPTPNTYMPQITAWCHRQIMDVGNLYGNLEVPDRWLMAIKWMLAHQTAIELPGVDLNRIQYLEGQADKYFNLAEQEERDKSPIMLAPNISPYTR
jgi:hypothetical protein